VRTLGEVGFDEDGQGFLPSMVMFAIQDVKVATVLGGDLNVLCARIVLYELMMNVVLTGFGMSPRQYGRVLAANAFGVCMKVARRDLKARQVGCLIKVSCVFAILETDALLTPPVIVVAATLDVNYECLVNSVLDVHTSAALIGIGNLRRLHGFQLVKIALTMLMVSVRLLTSAPCYLHCQRNAVLGHSVGVVASGG